ncbi:hypothetical protein [Clostridium perfringens]|uniref:hypothetical protein n=1 Tax=Clostridium perfringens TaxID=1502 RepID=UPI0018E4C8F6|nr:hypothetical protein [Clostridium perfringens]MBI6039876.1 hypothetical protein [Clostridium perfringens]
MNSELEEKIVSSYRGIRKLLGKNFKDNFVISKVSKDYNNLQEALSDFIEYEEILINIKCSEKFIFKKIVATKYYLMSILGYDITYNEYIKNTIGVNINYTSQDIIDDLIIEIKNKLKLLKLEYSKDDINNKFYNLTMSQDDLKNYLINEYNRQKKIVETYLNIKFDEMFDIEFIDEEIPYKYYLSNNNDKYILKVNLNLDVSKFNKASLRYAIAHEIFGHALQLSTWKMRIHKSEISQICGCEEDYGPEIFQLEGVAESIVYFIFEEEIDLEMEIELLLDKLHHLVQNNAYIMYNSGISLENCVNYYSNYYILNDEDYVRNRIYMSKEDSFYKANLYVYGDCLTKFIEICNELSKDERKIFLNKMYLQPMTSEEILSYSKSIQI